MISKITYNDVTSASSCKECSSGTYNDFTSATSCKECSVGTYNDQTSKPSCKQCSAGTYNNLTSAARCKECSTGKYSGQTSQTSAASCKECIGDNSYITIDRSSCNEYSLCQNSKGVIKNTRESTNTDMISNGTFCSCGSTNVICNEESGLYCSASVKMCTVGQTQCGSTSSSFDARKCQVITDRCTCSQCTFGFHTANCIPCKH